MLCCSLKVTDILEEHIPQARNQHESKQQLATSFHACYLLSLFIDPEDGGDMNL
jgi:hypothetical protein